VAWLAAWGFDRLRESDKPAQQFVIKWLTGLWSLVMVLVVFVFCTMPRWPDWPGLGYPGFWIPLLTVVVALGCLTIGARITSSHAGLKILVPLAAFVELWMTIGEHELGRGSPNGFARPGDFPRVVQWLRNRETFGPPPRWLIRPEIWHERGQDWLVPAKFGSAWGLSVVNPYSQSMPRSLSRLLHLDLNGNADFDRVLAEGRGLSAVGGRYIVTTIPITSRLLESGDRPYRLLARFDPDLYVYENTNARPFATLVTEVRFAEKEQDAADGIISADPAVREVAYVVPSSHDWHDRQVSPMYFAPGIVRIHAYKPDDIVMEASSPGEGFLVVAVTRAIGWSAGKRGRNRCTHSRRRWSLNGSANRAGRTYNPFSVPTGAVLVRYCRSGGWIGWSVVGGLRWRQV
jgi:hypothetical protein